MPLARIPFRLPPVLTDADWAQDFEFYSEDISTPAPFAADDGASLTLSLRRADPPVKLELTSAAGDLVFPAAHVIGVRRADETLAALTPGLYDFELRRLGADGAIEALAVGEVQIVSGLSTATPGNLAGIAGGAAAVKIVEVAGSAALIVRGPGGAIGAEGPAGQPIAVGADIAGAVTLALGDANTYRRCINAAAAIVTVPAEAAVAFAVGTQVSLRQTSAAVTLAAAAGVTVNPPFGGSLVLAGAGATVSLVKVAADQWDAIGQFEAAP